MIFSGRKRSATCRAKRRITRKGTSAPRYQREWGAGGEMVRLMFMLPLYMSRGDPEVGTNHGMRSSSNSKPLHGIAIELDAQPRFGRYFQKSFRIRPARL